MSSRNDCYLNVFLLLLLKNPFSLETSICKMLDDYLHDNNKKIKTNLCILMLEQLTCGLLGRRPPFLLVVVIEFESNKKSVF